MRQQLRIPPQLTGRDAGMAFEGLIKIHRIIKAALQRHFHHGLPLILSADQPFCLLDTHDGDVFPEGNTIELLEQMGEIIGTQMDQLRQFTQCDFLAQMLFDVVIDRQHIKGPVFVFAGGNGAVALIAEQFNEQKLEMCFDCNRMQFIAFQKLFFNFPVLLLQHACPLCRNPIFKIRCMGKTEVNKSSAGIQGIIVLQVSWLKM